MRTILVIPMLLMLTACGAGQIDGSEQPVPVTESTTTTVLDLPVTTVGSTAPPEGVEGVEPSVPDPLDVFIAPPETLVIGEPTPIQLWYGCGVVLDVDGIRHVPDRVIARRSEGGFVRSDFPAEWDVIPFNLEFEDGPAWVILDAQATRIDDQRIEVRHLGTGRLIAVMLPDPTPPEEIAQCG